MNIVSLITIIVLSIVTIIVVVLVLFYYFIFPKMIVKKIRNGEEQLKFPDGFKEILSKISIQHAEYISSYPNSSFDLYTPVNEDPKAIIIWIHGGFFIAGDKCGVSNVCSFLASNNYLVAAINYAVAPENKYPTAILQTNDFITYFQDNYSKYNHLPIFIAGDSAGGQIAFQYSLTIFSQSLQKDMNFIPILSPKSLKGIMLICSPIDLSELVGTSKTIKYLLPVFGRIYFGKGHWHKFDKFKSTKLFNYICDDLPPIFLTDGNTISFENQNKKLGEKLREKNVNVEELYFDICQGIVNHEYLFDMTLPCSQFGLKKILDFLKSILS